MKKLTRDKMRNIIGGDAVLSVNGAAPCVAVGTLCNSGDICCDNGGYQGKCPSQESAKS